MSDEQHDKKMKFLSLTITLGALALPAAQSLAGEVEIRPNRTNSILQIIGSDTADNIALRQDGSGRVVVIARGTDTTLNFEGNIFTDRVRLPDTINRITVSMLGGNDRMQVFRIDRPRLNADMGSGNDRVFLSSTANFVQGDIDGGEGRDVVVGEISALEVVNNDNEVLRRLTSTVSPDPAGPISGGTNVSVGTSDLTSPINSSQRYIFPANFSSDIRIDEFNATAGNGFPEDVVDLSAIDAYINEPGNQAFTLVHAFTGRAGELRVPNGGITAGTVIVQGLGAGDVDGDGVADFNIRSINSFGSFSQGSFENNIVR